MVGWKQFSESATVQRVNETFISYRLAVIKSKIIKILIKHWKVSCIFDKVKVIKKVVNVSTFIKLNSDYIEIITKKGKISFKGLHSTNLADFVAVLTFRLRIFPLETSLKEIVWLDLAVK